MPSHQRILAHQVLDKIACGGTVGFLDISVALQKVMCQICCHLHDKHRLCLFQKLRKPLQQGMPCETCLAGSIRRLERNLGLRLKYSSYTSQIIFSQKGIFVLHSLHTLQPDPLELFQIFLYQLLSATF